MTEPAARPDSVSCGPYQRPRIIGIGNSDRGDDGVGIWVANRIASADWPGVAVVSLDSADGTALLSAWQGADVAYVVDAVHAELPAGSVVRMVVSPGQRIGATLRSLSSHGLGLQEAIDLGGALGMLPRRLVVYGVVGESFETGRGLSAPVARSGGNVMRRLRGALDRSTRVA